MYIEVEKDICENVIGRCVKIQLNCCGMTVTSLSSFALLGLVVGVDLIFLLI